MKVLLIDVNCKNSSTGKIVYDLYTGINAAGEVAAVCYGRGQLVEGKNIFKFGLDWETKLHALLTRVTGFTGCFSFFSTRRLLRFVENYQPDVVHIHELHAYFVNTKPLLTYLAKADIPVVWTFHCEFVYTGKCGHAYECEKWKRGCGHCPSLRDYPKTFFFDQTRYMFKQKQASLNAIERLTIVTPSQWLADRVKQTFLSSREIKVIHNGIDTEIFHPRNTSALRERYKIGTDEKVVLAVAPGIMSESKGGRWVLQLAEMMLDKDVRFFLIGADDTKVTHPKNATILPRISNQIELAEFYSLTDVFVICSKKETYSMTCAEALCCGAYVVGFECGAPETVYKEPFASFSQYGDIGQLFDKVNKRLYFELDKVGSSQQAETQLSNKTMIRRYFQLYFELIGRLE